MNLEVIKQKINPKLIKDNVFFKDITTFRAGGLAGLFVEPENVDELISVLGIVKDEKVPYMIIGNGSNLLASDEGYEGVVIHLSGEFGMIKAEGTCVTAGAAAMLSRVCTQARDNALSGLEFAYGIPGTVGGAMVMNAGAYGGEMVMVVESVEVLTPGLQVVTMSNSEMKFSYRHSILKEEELIVLSATFKLTEGIREEIDGKMQDFMGRRKAKQPIELPSAGSTFKRPTGYFAGKLIEDAGLRGFRVGGASVSTKHCGFVVNDKQGTASDINELMNQIVDRVYKSSGVTLEPEVIKIGRF